jgi:hypothetical protein
MLTPQAGILSMYSPAFKLHYLLWPEYILTDWKVTENVSLFCPPFEEKLSENDTSRNYGFHCTSWYFHLNDS